MRERQRAWGVYVQYMGASGSSPEGKICQDEGSERREGEEMI